MEACGEKLGVVAAPHYVEDGSFPPALARWAVEKFSDRGQVVLDPFSGKGTVPLEACISNRFGVGNDLAPEAYVVTRAK
jgi:DNA modification methylase